MTTPKPDHDALYHRFFSDPAVVAQLVREFVAGPWLEGLDLDAMERLATTFHADTGERRAGDMVWRIPGRDGGDAYVMLLLEFQSTPDHWMALRMLVYAGLLWQQLVREKRLLPDGRLPPILPVVLYNGDPRWQAPLEIRDLIGLPGTSPMWQWQPDMRYHMIDEGALGSSDLEGREGLPALLFRLENASDPIDLLALADAVVTWFAGHPGFEAARKVFVDMLNVAMAPAGPDVRVPEALLEVRNMLATRMEQWMRRWEQEKEQEAKERGEQQGREQGLQQGLQQGLHQGREQGLHQGLQQGEASLLLRQLQRRFGVLPDGTRDRVLAADVAMIEEWALRVLDAATLEDVFA